MLIAYIVLLVSITSFHVQEYHAYEYCINKDHLCNKGVRHIVCDPSALPMQGKLLGIVPMTPKIKNMLLDMHNNIRSKAACGVAKDTHKNPFPNASRMRQLIWDYELAYIAKIHAERCTSEHDKCRNTERFRKSGQNIGGPFSNPLQLVSKSLDLWFDEHRLVKDSTLNVKALPDDNEIKKFTLIVNDRVSRVGCAISKCSIGGDPNQFFLTCNYDYDNVIDEPIYQTGAVGSKCSDWDTYLDCDHKCLCYNN